MNAPPHNSEWLPLPAQQQLTPNQIHILQSPTQLSEAQLTGFASSLSAEEHQRVAQLKIPAKRADAIVSRGLLRQFLALLLQADPHELTFQTGPHGKPSLHQTWNSHSLEFNVSHTHDKLLIAVTLDSPLGIDIECIRPNIAHLELAKRFFTPTESAALTALPTDQQLSAFFTYWTRKEALMKAAGRGIAYGLDSFEIPLTPTPQPTPSILATPTLGQWILQDLTPSPSYAACLAYTTPNPQILTWHTL